MKPYVAMVNIQDFIFILIYEILFFQGKEAGYDILLIEPQTPWRYKARELFK